MGDRLEQVVLAHDYFMSDEFDAVPVDVSLGALGNKRHFEHIGAYVGVFADLITRELVVAERESFTRHFRSYVHAVEQYAIVIVARVLFDLERHAAALLHLAYFGVFHTAADAVDGRVNALNGIRAARILDRAYHERAEALDGSYYSVFGDDARHRLDGVYGAVGFARVMKDRKCHAGVLGTVALGEAESHLHIAARRHLLHDAANVKIDLIGRAVEYIALAYARVAVFVEHGVHHCVAFGFARLVDDEHELTALIPDDRLSVLVLEVVHGFVARAHELRFAVHLHIQSAVIEDLRTNYVLSRKGQITAGIGHLSAVLTLEIDGRKVIHVLIVRIILRRIESKRQFVFGGVPLYVAYGPLDELAFFIHYRQIDDVIVAYFIAVCRYECFAVSELDIQRVEFFNIAFLVGHRLDYVRRGYVFTVSRIAVNYARSHNAGVGDVCGIVNGDLAQKVHHIGRIVYYAELNVR